MTWIRVADIGSFELTANEQFAAVTLLLQELTTCRELQQIYGRLGGYLQYIEAGGHVAFNEAGQPIIQLEVLETYARKFYESDT
jgi:hypothetical protein